MKITPILLSLCVNCLFGAKKQKTKEQPLPQEQQPFPRRNQKYPESNDDQDNGISNQDDSTSALFQCHQKCHENKSNQQVAKMRHKIDEEAKQ